MKNTFKFKNLIGFRLDTNQFTSKTIENIAEAKTYVDKVIKLLQPTKKDGLSLFSALNL